MREIESLNACFQSVMKASYVMKAARHACTHNHSCILLGYGLLVPVRCAHAARSMYIDMKVTSPLHTSQVRKLVRARKSVPARKLVRVWSLNSKVNTDFYGSDSTNRCQCSDNWNVAACLALMLAIATTCTCHAMACCVPHYRRISRTLIFLSQKLPCISRFV